MSVLFGENDITLFNPEIRYIRRQLVNSIQHTKIQDVHTPPNRTLSWNSLGNKIFHAVNQNVVLYHLAEDGRLLPDQQITTISTQYPKPADDQEPTDTPIDPVITRTTNRQCTSRRTSAHNGLILGGSFFKSDPNTFYTYAADNTICLYDTRTKAISTKTILSPSTILGAAENATTHQMLFLDDTNTCHIYDYRFIRYAVPPQVVSIPQTSSIGLLKPQQQSNATDRRGKSSQSGTDGPTPYDGAASSVIHSSTVAFPSITACGFVPRFSYAVCGTTHGNVFMSNMKTGSIVNSLQTSTSPISSINVSSRGDRIITGAHDGSVNVIDFPGFTTDTIIQTHSAPVILGRFSHDNSVLATVSFQQQDCTGMTTLSSARSGSTIANLTPAHPIISFDWHPSRLIYASLHYNKTKSMASVVVSSLKDSETTQPIDDNNPISKRRLMVQKKLSSLRSSSHGDSSSSSSSSTTTAHHSTTPPSAFSMTSPSTVTDPVKPGYTRYNETNNNGVNIQTQIVNLSSFSTEAIRMKRIEVQPLDEPTPYDFLGTDNVKGKGSGIGTGTGAGARGRDALLSKNLSSSLRQYDRGGGYNSSSHAYQGAGSGGGSGGGSHRSRRDRENSDRYDGAASSGSGGASTGTGGHGYRDRGRDGGRDGGRDNNDRRQYDNNRQGWREDRYRGDDRDSSGGSGRSDGGGRERDRRYGNRRY